MLWFQTTDGKGLAEMTFTRLIIDNYNNNLKASKRRLYTQIELVILASYSVTVG